MRECGNSNCQVVSDSEEFRATVMLVKGMHLALNESFKQSKQERMEERQQDRAQVEVLMEQTHVFMEQTNQQLSAMSANVQQLIQLSIEQQHHQYLDRMTTHGMDKHPQPPAPLLREHRTCTQPQADGTATPRSIPALGGLAAVSETSTGAKVAREVGVAEQEGLPAGRGWNAGGGDGDDAGGARGRGQKAGEAPADGIKGNGLSLRQRARATTSQLGCVCVRERDRERERERERESACARACRHVCGVCARAATCQRPPSPDTGLQPSCLRKGVAACRQASCRPRHAAARVGRGVGLVCLSNYL